MPKQKKRIDSRRNFLRPYFAPSGSKPGIQVRLPNLLPTLDNTSLNINTGNRPGSNPSNPSKGSNAWSDFDKYGGRALLIGTGAHLAYKGGKYLQQRFLTSQGRDFAPGNEPSLPSANVEPPQIEVLPDELPSESAGTIEMTNLNAPVQEAGEEFIPQVGAESESFWSRISNWFSRAGSSVESAAEEAGTELVPLLTEAAESGAIVP